MEPTLEKVLEENRVLRENIGRYQVLMETAAETIVGLRLELEEKEGNLIGTYA